MYSGISLPMAMASSQLHEDNGDQLDHTFAKVSASNSCANSLPQAMISVADDMFPLKKHSVVGIPSPLWCDQECTRAVAERREAEILYCRNMSQENFINVSKIRAKPRRLLRRKKLEGWRSFCESISVMSRPTQFENKFVNFAVLFTRQFPVPEHFRVDSPVHE
ncbi:hypothetical protein EVAR_102575_1 [Eumeta japonica]|uniref:Uncharacterized protein n=1 Tax=Eumeta variegata TaxID=151549 RepID=A0A4C1SLR0_EUMVA|nr:hypothetical protein EVAR_102575_1 [Eumeta japonica]